MSHLLKAAEQIANAVAALEHSVDEDAVPPGKEWCYVNGPSLASELVSAAVMLMDAWPASDAEHKKAEALVRGARPGERT